ncbi:MAG: ankyrin repeat domain-containing protein, partial [Planctomycetota bacterium]|nr:ankyrin repeat domain-containing protein [Planctomycetota bacterium]
AVRLKELSRRQQDRNQTDKAREKARKDLEFLSKVHAYCQREVLRGRLDEVAGHLGAGERLVHEKYYDGAIEAYEKAWRLLEELQEKLDSAVGSGRVRNECAAQERAWSELSHSGRGRFREFLSSRRTFLEKESRAREFLIEAERLAGLGEYGQAAPLFERANELFRALSVEAPAEYDAWQAMQQADRDGRTFLHRAAERGALEEAQDLLRRGATLDARDYQGATPLHLAARSGSVRLVEFLIERGASTSSRDRMNQTPLHFAVMGGNRSVVEALLRRGARRGRISKRGWAPIHLAITKGHTDIALLLIDSGTDVDLVDSTGLTPLHYACLHGQTELARRLVAQKARLDRKGGLSRNTPLHLAARQGHLEVVRFLLESGARARVPNAQGRYAVELGRRHQEVRELLRQHESGGGHP